MLLETRGLSRSFGPVRALRDVSFAVRAGEVHGLMGENGAGKSTLIKLLTGFNQPDGGEILLDDKPVVFGSPRDAQAHGVAAVYQEINLIPERSVADNLFLGREPRRFGVLTDRARMLDDSAALLRRYRLAIDPRRTLGTLGLGLQQLVSIARVVSLGARVVILDEPTSALSGNEVELLYEVVEQLRQDGIGLVYVSHRLSECYRLCDRLTVLRDGAVVASDATDAMPRARLLAAMLGRGPEASSRATAAPPAEPGRTAAAAPEAALSVQALSWRDRVRAVSFQVGSGEIVGLAGLLGSGRTETMKAAFGAARAEAGAVLIGGRRQARPGPAASIRDGLAFLSEDRRAEGVFPHLSVADNLTASVLPRIARWGIVSQRKRDALVGRFVGELGIKTAGPDAPITALSGGNQQKVLIARALCTDPRMVMLDDPTRGIDVGAKAEVHRLVRALAANGLGVLVTSSELEEVVELCSRLVLLDEGRVGGEIDTAGRDADDVLALMAEAAPPQEHAA